MTTTVRRIAFTMVSRLTMRRQPSPPACGVVASDVMGHAPWRVFLSHTSELRSQPAERSFAAAAEAAIIRAGHAITDMAYFAARDADSAQLCTAMVARADVYVCIVGGRYGEPVPSRPAQSFTELEFATATGLGLPRLAFLVREDTPCLTPTDEPAEHRLRQSAFRDRLRRSGLTLGHVSTPADLELGLLQALAELRTESVALAAFRAAATAAASGAPILW